jgi:hypothetical protein
MGTTPAREHAMARIAIANSVDRLANRERTVAVRVMSPKPQARKRAVITVQI